MRLFYGSTISWDSAGTGNDPNIHVFLYTNPELEVMYQGLDYEERYQAALDYHTNHLATNTGKIDFISMMDPAIFDTKFDDIYYWLHYESHVRDGTTFNLADTAYTWDDPDSPTVYTNTTLELWNHLYTHDRRRLCIIHWLRYGRTLVAPDDLHQRVPDEFWPRYYGDLYKNGHYPVNGGARAMYKEYLERQKNWNTTIVIILPLTEATIVAFYPVGNPTDLALRDAIPRSVSGDTVTPPGSITFHSNIQADPMGAYTPSTIMQGNIIFDTVNANLYDRDVTLWSEPNMDVTRTDPTKPFMLSLDLTVKQLSAAAGRVITFSAAGDIVHRDRHWNLSGGPTTFSNTLCVLGDMTLNGTAFTGPTSVTSTTNHDWTYGGTTMTTSNLTHSGTITATSLTPTTLTSLTAPSVTTQDLTIPSPYTLTAQTASVGTLTTVGALLSNVYLPNVTGPQYAATTTLASNGTMTTSGVVQDYHVYSDVAGGTWGLPGTVTPASVDATYVRGIIENQTTHPLTVGSINCQPQGLTRYLAQIDSNATYTLMRANDPHITDHPTTTFGSLTVSNAVTGSGAATVTSNTQAGSLAANNVLVTGAKTTISGTTTATGTVTMTGTHTAANMTAGHLKIATSPIITGPSITNISTHLATLPTALGNKIFVVDISGIALLSHSVNLPASVTGDLAEFIIINDSPSTYVRLVASAGVTVEPATAIPGKMALRFRIRDTGASTWVVEPLLQKY